MVLEGWRQLRAGYSVVDADVKEKKGLAPLSKFLKPSGTDLVGWMRHLRSRAARDQRSSESPDLARMESPDLARMLQRIVCILLLGLASPFSAASASQTFEDPYGRFVVEIPNNWELKAEDEYGFVFERGTGNEHTFIFQYFPEINAINRLFAAAMQKIVFSAGLREPTLVGIAEDLLVSGSPARRATFACNYRSHENSTEFHVHVGAVLLDSGGLTLIVIRKPPTLEQEMPTVEAVFGSIHDVGREPTGISGVKVCTTDLTEGFSRGKLRFASERVSMVLPAGWVERPRGQNFEDIVFGSFTAEHMLDAFLVGSCQRKFGLTLEKLVKAAKITVEFIIPNAEVVKFYEEELGRRRSMFVVVYEGSVVADGIEVAMTDVTVSLKADKCWVNLVGSVRREAGDRLEEELVEIARTVQ